MRLQLSVRRHASPLVLFAALWVCFPSAAHADDESDPASESAEPPYEGPDVARRAVPDLDGRPEPGDDAGDVLIWIPRVLFWPLHALFEYVLRLPLGWLLTTAEREQWDIVQIPPFAAGQQTWGFLPTAFFDFGFRPSIGLNLWFNEAGVPENAIEMRAAFGGVDHLRGTATDRVTLGDPNSDGFYGTIEFEVDAMMRPDYTFLGLGPEVSPDRIARYGRRRLDGEVRATLRPWRASELRVSAGVSANEIYDTTYLEPNEETLSVALAAGRFGDAARGVEGDLAGYTGYFQRIDLILDTRARGRSGESGLRIEAHAEHGVDLLQAPRRNWLLWGGALGGFVELGSGRSLGLWAVVELASPFGSQTIPFTELPDLGGRGRMTGFRPGWVTGRSATLLSLEYRFAIWVFAEGVLNATIGNAFDDMFAGFDVARLRTSYAMGIRTLGDPDSALTIQIGFGTATFESGLDPISFRATVGTQNGF